MLLVKTLLISALVALGSSTYSLSMFWCGFNWAFCGQSKTNDVNSKANLFCLHLLTSNLMDQF